MKILMKTISVVFHPLLVATHLSAILIIKAPELIPRIQPQVVPQFLLIIFLITAIMPAFSVFLLKTFKYISDLELIKKKERIIPFIFILFYYAIASYLFHEKLGMDLLFNVVIISATVLILILTLITLRFKISIHAASMWAAVGYTSAILVSFGAALGGAFYALIFAAGLISSSRLYLGYHTPREVWTGAILGFSYAFLTIIVLL
ncbi:MAG: hypothetical protein Tsb0034_07790 [Ekhidna sp.]